jgi:hypothetical protein
MWVAFLAANSEAAGAIRCIQAVAETEGSRKLRVLSTSNDGEFTATEFAAYCTDEGVTRHFSVLYALQQNRVVERQNQTGIKL